MALALSVPLGMLLARVTGITWASRSFHRFSSKITARLNRHEREPYSLAMRGFFVAGVLILAAWIAGMLIDAVIYPSHRHSSLVAVVLLAALFNGAGILYPLAMMARAAKQHAWPRLDDYLKILAPGAHAADGHGKLRIAIMLAATHMQHRIIGSALAFIVADFEGLLAYRALHLCVLHAPSSLSTHRAFGLVTGWLFTPLRGISYLVFLKWATLAGACIPGCKPLSALAHCGSMASYCAHMLQASFGGSYTLYGKTFHDAWVGTGTAKIDVPHTRRSAWWMLALCVVATLCIAGLHILQPIFNL